MKTIACLAVAALVAGVAAHAQAAPLEAYGSLPAIEGATVSPDGQLLAIAVTQGEDRGIVIEQLSDKKAVAALRFGDVELRNIRWAGSNHLLVTILYRGLIESTDARKRIIGGGDEHLAVVDYNVATHAQRDLMSGQPSSVPDVVFGAPTTRVIDGKPFAFLKGEVFPEQGGMATVALFKSDLDRGSTFEVETEAHNVTNWVLDAHGDLLAETTYDAPSATWTLRMRKGSDWRIVKTVVAPVERPSLDGLAADGRSVLITDYVDGERVLRQMAPDATDWSQPLGPNAAALIDDPQTGALVAQVARAGDTLQYAFTDPQAQRYWQAAVAAYPGESVTYEGSSADHKVIVLQADSPTDGPAFAIVDLNAKSGSWIGNAYPSLTPDDIGEKRHIAFKAADGLPLTGYLTLPHGKDAKNLPLVVLVHAGPAASDAPGFGWWPQALASRGYAVLQVNYRGSDGLGPILRDAGFGQWGRKMQTDLSDGVRYLAAQGIIDPKRVCIAGVDYGGYAALAGATIDRGAYRCAVAIAAPSDLRAMIKSAESNAGSQAALAQRIWDQYLAVAGSGDPELDQLSPARLADRADIPVLLIHGTDDQNVPFSQSQEMADALKRAGKTVDLVAIKNGDHSLSRGDTRLQVLQAMVDFLEKNNPPS